MIPTSYINVSNITLSDGWMWWPLLGVLLPIIIHLLSKREKNIVSFGSLQFLQPLESESARSVQLSQYTLLFLRLLLLGALGILLAGPILEEDAVKGTSYWIEEAVYHAPEYAPILSKLPEDAEINVFTHSASDSLEVRQFTSAWTLIDLLNDSEDSSVVYSFSLEKNFIGAPRTLSTLTSWNILPFKNRAAQKGTASNGTKSIEWSILSDHEQLSVKESAADQNATPSTIKMHLQIKVDQAAEDTDAIKNVIQLTEEYLYYNIDWVKSPEAADGLITILKKTEAAPQALVNKMHGASIIWQPAEEPIQIDFSDQQTLKFRGKIDRESLLDSNLPVAIASYLNKYFTDIEAYDIRTFDPTSLTEIQQLDIAAAPLKTQETQSKNERPLNSWLLFLIVPIFIIERIVQSKGSSQR